MAFSQAEVDELKRLFPDVLRCEEGDRIYFLLPGLPLPEGCKPERTDALLCPTDLDGYPSRLFFADKVECPAARNWNAIGKRIVERNWNTFSWKVNSNLRLAQLIAAHLKGLR